MTRDNVEFVNFKHEKYRKNVNIGEDRSRPKYIRETVREKTNEE